MTMRVLYSVHGYGRGHATRTMAVLPHLMRPGRRILCLAGGDAYQTLAGEFPSVQIPAMGFTYRPRSGRLSLAATVLHNLPAALDLAFRGPVFSLVRDVMLDFRPDVVISDAEAWSHRVAEHLQIPRISFDHFGLLAHCRPQFDMRDRIPALAHAWCYRWLMRQPDRALVSSFHDAPARQPGVQVIGTLLRPSVRSAVSVPGEHLLVYFNRGLDQFRPGTLDVLRSLQIPVRVYCLEPREKIDQVSFHAMHPQTFVTDLAACRAIISTAGNQLIGEAVHLRKPLCVLPEDCVEQRMNAAAIERMGIGMRLHPSQLSLPALQKFLGQLETYRERMAAHGCDGTSDAARILEEFIQQLAPAAAAEEQQMPPRISTSEAA
ncbi:MAG: glycosyltransferase family protein [Planctomycetaceae bacterium]